MPRLLPRLRQAWREVRDIVREPRVLVARPPKPKKPTGTRLPIERAISALSVENRTRSVLLEPRNPVQRKHDYQYRRAPGPRVWGKHLVQPKIDPRRHSLPSRTRRMTVQEREWWSSPYCECAHNRDVLSVAHLRVSEDAGRTPPSMQSVGKTLAHRSVACSSSATY